METRRDSAHHSGMVGFRSAALLAVRDPCSRNWDPAFWPGNTYLVRVMWQKARKNRDFLIFRPSKMTRIGTVAAKTRDKIG